MMRRLRSTGKQGFGVAARIHIHGDTVLILNLLFFFQSRLHLQLIFLLTDELSQVILRLNSELSSELSLCWLRFFWRFRWINHLLKILKYLLEVTYSTSFHYLVSNFSIVVNISNFKHFINFFLWHFHGKVSHDELKIRFVEIFLMYFVFLCSEQFRVGISPNQHLIQTINIISSLSWPSH